MLKGYYMPDIGEKLRTKQMNRLFPWNLHAVREIDKNSVSHCIAS